MYCLQRTEILSSLSVITISIVILLNRIHRLSRAPIANSFLTNGVTLVKERFSFIDLYIYSFLQYLQKNNVNHLLYHHYFLLNFVAVPEH